MMPAGEEASGLDPVWRSVAAYATDGRRSRGRLVPEPDSPTRTPYQRDRDRIIHSAAFRRLKHKTQVFIAHEGDHFRTRLTHTIEVAQIARSLARALLLDEDLAEALALAHDLGHTPFGHAGERALDAAMRDSGGFDHNAQSLKIVTALEHRYAAFDGLNLSWETLEGLIKHNGPLAAPIPAYVAQYDQAHPLELHSHAGPEAQAAAIADDIAYDAHDIDDGLRAGLFAIDELRIVPLLADLLADIDRKHPGLDAGRRGHELQRRLITRFVEDVITTSRGRLGAGFASVEGIRAARQPVVTCSAPIAEADRAIKRFLFERMYRSETVMRVMNAAGDILTDLHHRLLADPRLLPEDWQARAGTGDPAVIIGDFIAGMTDPYAINLHRRLFDATPDLR
jgi:dGTPase